MTKFTVTLYGGYMYIVDAVSLETARNLALIEQGSSNVRSVTLATEEDIAWFNAMRGFAPARKKLPSEWAQEGYFVVEGGKLPKVGAELDYYNQFGNKCFGKVKSIDGDTITIEGEYKLIKTDVFRIKYGR